MLSKTHQKKWDNAYIHSLKFQSNQGPKSDPKLLPIGAPFTQMIHQLCSIGKMSETYLGSFQPNARDPPVWNSEMIHAKVLSTPSESGNESETDKKREEVKRIKEKMTNIKENFSFRFRFCSLWMDLNRCYSSN